MTSTKNARATRLRLIAERQAAITAKDWDRYHSLTRQLADLPMAGVPALTEADKRRYSKAHGRAEALQRPVRPCTVPHDRCGDCHGGLGCSKPGAYHRGEPCARCNTIHLTGAEAAACSRREDN